jgi:omega-6 fatty acid desaturase (delta-12 desaturase)
MRYKSAVGDPAEMTATGRSMSFAEQHPQAVAPRVGEDQHLAPSDAAGALIVAGCVLLTAAGIALGASQRWVAWLAGQVVLAVALLQWFVLLHEAGHLTLFRSRAANIAAGHVAGFFALIPFESWRRVHGLHHLWTGWQDLDPTTAALVPRELSPLERFAVDWAWRLWLPLFSVLYRVNNYWRVARVAKLFGARRVRVALHANAAALLLAYGGVALAFGASALLWTVGPALLLTLVLQDPLILSQHTHVPQNVSGGRRVAPIKAAQQERYTRSLRFPRLVAAGILINFNAHELHHRFVGVPGYRLARIPHRPQNEVGWWEWLREAKRMRGSVFLFSNRDDTGFRW